MATLTDPVTVIGGVDTHKNTHYAAAIDGQGRLLGHREFPATGPGYAALRAWMRSYGDVTSIGVESTGSFGAALARELTRSGEKVVEVNRPNHPTTCGKVCEDLSLVLHRPGLTPAKV